MRVVDVPVGARFRSADRNDGMVWQRLASKDPKAREAAEQIRADSSKIWAFIVNKGKYPELVFDTFYWYPDKEVELCSLSNALNRLETE